MTASGPWRPTVSKLLPIPISHLPSDVWYVKAMSDFQVLTVLATLLGIVATVLNLVAFVREKDRSHTRAGFHLLLILGVALGLFCLPRYAPGTARSLVAALPASAAPVLQPWLATAPSSTPAAAAVEMAPPVESKPPLLGSFTIEIQRNMLGGIGALVSNFQFSNPSTQSVQVTAYHVRITRKSGETAHSYDRVLSEPVLVDAGATAKTQVELDAEIRDQWVAREDQEAAERGPIEITWECQSAGGQPFVLKSSNG